MGIYGRVPTKVHEIRRWLRDACIDWQLGSEQGQARFWATLKTWSDSHSLVDLLRSTLELRGDVMECGVYRGQSILVIARAMQGIADHKTIYGLDSFSGFPVNAVSQRDLGLGRRIAHVRRKFRFCADTPARLNRIFRKFNINAKLVRGYFSETLPSFRDHPLCFIHLDCDIYASYKECLETLYDQLVPGGVIVFDEWNTANWPGAQRAVEEFFSTRPPVVQTCTTSERHCFYIRKPKAAETVPVPSAKREHDSRLYEPVPAFAE